MLLKVIYFLIKTVYYEILKLRLLSGNTLAIVCAFTDASLRTVGNKFIINLAISG